MAVDIEISRLCEPAVTVGDSFRLYLLVGIESGGLVSGISGRIAMCLGLNKRDRCTVVSIILVSICQAVPDTHNATWHAGIIVKTCGDRNRRLYATSQEGGFYVAERFSRLGTGVALNSLLVGIYVVVRH